LPPPLLVSPLLASPHHETSVWPSSSCALSACPSLSFLLHSY
jgi:hypothetical protein